MDQIDPSSYNDNRRYKKRRRLLYGIAKDKQKYSSRTYSSENGMLEDTLIGLAGVTEIRDGDTRFVVLALFSSLSTFRCAIALGSLAIDPVCSVVLSLLLAGFVYGLFAIRRRSIVGDGLARGRGG